MKFYFIVLAFMLIGCTSQKVSKPINQASASPVSQPEPSISKEALPEGLKTSSKLGETDLENDLIDAFNYDGNGIKVGLNVAVDKACFVYIRPTIPTKPGEVEMEFLKREKPGLWRGYQTQRVYTQAAGNKLKVYQNDELLSDYENSAVSNELIAATKDFKQRDKSFELLLRQDLAASSSARKVYTEQCAKLKSFYYREELQALDDKQKREFELDKKQTDR
ncbi:MAG: hypothetical protein KME64_41265 [Scytonematopsis contorta HA4267-MV1]|nr:hypothetical protein [Scytonematopsis contorta HA4267-MV1]